MANTSSGRSTSRSTTSRTGPSASLKKSTKPAKATTAKGAASIGRNVTRRAGTSGASTRER